MLNPQVDRLRGFAMEQRQKSGAGEDPAEALLDWMSGRYGPQGEPGTQSTQEDFGVKRTTSGEGQYSLEFTPVACHIARILFGDENSFHDLGVDPTAIVPGALIIGAVGGAVANFLPMRRLRKFTIEFVRPVPIGGTASLTLQRLPDGRRWSVLLAVLRNTEGKNICNPTTIYLEREKSD